MNELNSIIKRIKDLEKRLYGINYECHMKFEKICIGTELTDAKTFILNKYKPSKEKMERWERVEYHVFLRDFSEKLSYKGDANSGVVMNLKQENEFLYELHEFQSVIKQKFNPSKSIIYSLPELANYIFWGFCFVIISKERNAVYLFEGISSD